MRDKDAAFGNEGEGIRYVHSKPSDGIRLSNNGFELVNGATWVWHPKAI